MSERLIHSHRKCMHLIRYKYRPSHTKYVLSPPSLPPSLSLSVLLSSPPPLIFHPPLNHTLQVVQEEEVVTPSSLGPEESGGPFFKPVRVSSAERIKPQLPRQSSDQDIVRPVSATERGQYHAVMAWPKQQVIPGHLFQSSDKVST